VEPLAYDPIRRQIFAGFRCARDAAEAESG
jgi:hypothetical protein